ncbi:LysR family transcriptional regulator [uncultured Enterovirga sp.]|uniref:LysR family transcriptional regulator n=1 Tax=uncultured Enterovirga sp. TaxID=2026352 RepID=UPI0035CBE208
MVVFVEVGRHENFTKAAKMLDMPLSTVARRIALLEEELGMLLMERTTRHQRLTAYGRRFFERCRHVVDDALSAYDDLHAQVHGLQGRIHVTFSEELGGEVMAELIAAFLVEHPGLELHIGHSADAALPPAGTDLLVCTGMPTVAALVIRRIGSLGLGLFAAPDHLRVHGAIESRHDLKRHPILIPTSYRQHCEPLLRDLTVAPVNLSGQLQGDTIGIIRALAVSGRGIALLPSAVSTLYVAAGWLVPVLPTWVPVHLPILAVATSKLLPARIQAFVDFLTSRLSGQATDHWPSSPAGTSRLPPGMPASEARLGVA